MTKDLISEASFQFYMALKECVEEKRTHCVMYERGRWLWDSSLQDSATYVRIP